MEAGSGNAFVWEDGSGSALKSKLMSFRLLKMEPWRAVDARIGGSKCSRGGSLGQWSQSCITLMKSRIRTRIKVKSRPEPQWKLKWIRIRIKVMRIQKPAFKWVINDQSHYLKTTSYLISNDQKLKKITWMQRRQQRISYPCFLHLAIRFASAIFSLNMAKHHLFYLLTWWNVVIGGK